MAAHIASRPTPALKRPIVAPSRKIAFHPDSLVTKKAAESHLARSLRRAESLWDVFHALRQEKLRDALNARLRLHQDVGELISLIDSFADRIQQGQDISCEELSDIPDTDNLQKTVVRLLVHYRNLHEAERRAALAPRPRSLMERILGWFQKKPKPALLRRDVEDAVTKYKQAIRESLIELHRHLDRSIINLLERIGIEDNRREEFLNHHAHHLFHEIPSLEDGLERTHHHTAVSLHAHGLPHIKLSPSSDLIFFVEALRTVASRKKISGGELENLTIGTAIARYDREIMDAYAALRADPHYLTHAA